MKTGLGVVEDLSEAYTWYALACETRIADAAEAQKAEETRDQLKLRLLSAYPHPTEEELEDQVNAQKTQNRPVPGGDQKDQEVESQFLSNTEERICHALPEVG